MPPPLAPPEAAHFLVAHLLGIPVLSYSLDLGKEHTDRARAARVGAKACCAQRARREASAPSRLRTSPPSPPPPCPLGAVLEAGLQRKIVGYERLSASELDSLAVLAMSGVAAEAMRFPEVVGQARGWAWGWAWGAGFGC